METLRDAYRDEEDEDTTEKSNNGNGVHPTPTSTTPSQDEDTNNNHNPEFLQIKEEEQSVSDELSEAEATEEDEEEEEEEEEEEDEDLQQPQSKLQKRQKLEIPIVDLDEEDEEEDNTPRKKQKPLSSFTTEQTPQTQTMPLETVVVGMQKIQALTTPVVKKPKKKKSKNNNNVWTKPTSRKGKKKTKSNAFGNVVGSASASAADEDKVLITPVPRFPDRSDDSSDLNICLSKVYKAEKVELSDDRLTAGSSKGYRMVRATRGVVEGAWYFEIKVAKLGETGHTRLGWSMEKGDLQAPVGYDANSFGYRDIDGCKIHKAMREKYGEEGYVEGDVIGFYINLPHGSAYAPKLPQFVWYKGQRYMCAADGKEESQKVVPGSEISFFKNGVCQGVAFKDLYGGRYYPAASMYTLPNQPNCTVKFNFGPDFEYFPQDFDERPIPKPMIEVPYHGFDGKVENGETDEKEE